MGEWQKTIKSTESGGALTGDSGYLYACEINTEELTAASILKAKTDAIDARYKNRNMTADLIARKQKELADLGTDANLTEGKWYWLKKRGVLDGGLEVELDVNAPFYASFPYVMTDDVVLEMRLTQICWVSSITKTPTFTENEIKTLCYNTKNISPTISWGGSVEGIYETNNAWIQEIQGTAEYVYTYGTKLAKSKPDPNKVFIFLFALNEKRAVKGEFIDVHYLPMKISIGDSTFNTENLAFTFNYTLAGDYNPSVHRIKYNDKRLNW